MPSLGAIMSRKVTVQDTPGGVLRKSRRRRGNGL
jgi:hypothetical protein